MELEEYKHEKQLSLWRHSGFRKAYLGGGRGEIFLASPRLKFISILFSLK